MPHLASDQVRALVSGLPRRERERRRIMVLQAAVDDSGSEPQAHFFVLGGFIAPSNSWCDFADAWETALHAPPRIDYFKLNEAFGKKKQFDGWDEITIANKIESLVDVILAHVQTRIHAVIRHDEFERYFQSIPAPKRHAAIENPYVLLGMQLILAVAVWAPVRNISSPVDFIFDEQGKYSDALQQWYPIFKRQAQLGARTDIANYLGHPPKFEKDTDFMPLQAADLYAGLVRRHCMNNKILEAPMPIPLRRLVAALRGIPRHYMADELRRLNEHLQKEGVKFYAANPSARKLYKHIKPKRPKLKK